MSIVLDTRTDNHLYLGTSGDVALEEDDGANFVGLDEGYDVGAGGVTTEAYKEELRRSMSGSSRKHKGTMALLGPVASWPHTPPSDRKKIDKEAKIQGSDMGRMTPASQTR